MSLTVFGAGPVARAFIDQWLDRSLDPSPNQPQDTAQTTPELRWAGVDPPSLERWLRRRRGPAPERRGPSALTWSAARVQLSKASAPPSAEPKGPPIVDARDDERPLLLGGGRRKPAPIDPVAVLALEPLITALDSGPGLRWAVATHLAGHREGRPSSLGLTALPRTEALASALGRRSSATLGRVAISACAGPQLGDSLELSALLGRGASLDSVRDWLASLADPRLLEAPSARSDDALGLSALLIDTAALDGAGPLVRIVGHFDPAAWLAAELHRKLG